jgi:predicted alpha/beta superfamily hydrolase
MREPSMGWKLWIAANLAFLFCATALLAQSEAPIPFVSSFSIHSTILEEERTIVIALPAGYEEGSTAYPVLYLLDGLQNIWHVAGSAEVLTRTGAMPPVIIVGIQSVNRMRDFTPSSVNDVPYSGGGPKFLDFISKELVPYIDTHYRTHPYRVLEGHSLAGIFAANTFLENTQMFHAYIVMSPAMWWNKEELTAKAKIFFKTHTKFNTSLYLGIGGADGQGMRNELGRFVEVIDQNQPGGLRWEHREMEGEGHMSAPLLINYYGLKFVFSDLQLPEQLRVNFDAEQFLAHEKKIVETYGEAAKQSEENYVTLGLKLISDENYQGAIAVFNRNIEAYPVYPRNYAWLADAYEHNLNYPKALEFYIQALEKSQEINFGQEENYTAQIERLKALIEEGL